MRGIMNKANLVYTLVMAFCIILLAGCVIAQKSTHHASINIMIESEDVHTSDAMQIRKKQSEETIPIITKIILEHGLEAVTDNNTRFNTFVTGISDKDTVLRFKGKSTGKNNTIPLEAMIIIDGDTYEKITINLSEGYSKEPSERLVDLYSKLDETLDQVEANKYHSKIW